MKETTSSLNPSTNAWQGDWRERIYQALEPLGYQSLTTYCANTPTQPLYLIAQQLGPDIAPIQLEWLLRQETEQDNNLDHFAQTILVRYLHELIPEGWGIAPDSDFLSAHAYAKWSSALGKGYKDLNKQVWAQLKASPALFPGWLPQGVADPVIADAFRGISYQPQENNINNLYGIINP